jgi:SHAQKYF class myb-like DNA-binding protein
MVITSRVHTTFFAPTSTVSKTLIRLPPSVVQQYETRCELSGRVLESGPKPPHRIHLWSSDEHDRFLRGLEMFPNGPWKEIAAIVGTKTTRQTMTHAQKYRQKIERRLLDRPVHRVKKCPPLPMRKTKPRTHALSALEKIDLVYGESETLSQRDHALLSGANGAASPLDISYGVGHGYDTDLEALLAYLDPLPPLRAMNDDFSC